MARWLGRAMGGAAALCFCLAAPRAAPPASPEAATACRCLGDLEKRVSCLETEMAALAAKAGLARDEPGAGAPPRDPRADVAMWAAFAIAALAGAAVWWKRASLDLEGLKSKHHAEARAAAVKAEAALVEALSRALREPETVEGLVRHAQKVREGLGRVHQELAAIWPPAAPSGKTP